MDFTLILLNLAIYFSHCNYNVLYLCMKAIVFYELALHFNPHCAEACNNLGVIYKDRDNLDKAVECYQVSAILRSW